MTSGETVKVRHDIQETSLQAYREIQPTLSQKQTIIYNVLVDATRKRFDMTNMEIAKLLGWSINRVTPRVWELRHDLHLVVLSQRRHCGVTKRNAMAWKALFKEA